MPARKNATPAKTKAKLDTAALDFEAKLWLTADKPQAARRANEARQYKHVVLGIIFLKYISDGFEEHHAKLIKGSTRTSRAGSGAPADHLDQYTGANPEGPVEYRPEHIFWMPPDARWSHLQTNAKQPTIGKIVDDTMVAIERNNPRLKGVLTKNHAHHALDKHRLSELIDLINTLGLNDAENRDKDIFDRVYEYFLTQFASAEGRHSPGTRGGRPRRMHDRVPGLS
ncbi:MAG TPA: type I restriction-modification system subunit M N-terminal domain-containing protein [Chthoniobacteraceae bacterium]|nr:type I restriction-modification system subunit M N-terminal domain-containing protein [Chthoniobacteraceae bacterium]